MSNIVLIVGNVNSARVMRQRPELFADLATGERFAVKYAVPTAYVGKRAEFDGDDKAWKSHCRKAFSAASDRAQDQCDEIALATAGGTLNVLYASDAFESDPANGIYSPVPNPRAYMSLADAADNVVSLPSVNA